MSGIADIYSVPESFPYSLEYREAQASACLEAAALHKAQLLAVAVKLAGSKEGGMDLFQETCLNCHDAIQHRGFAGSEFRFYLLTAIRRQHHRTQQEARRFVGLDGLEEAPISPATTDAQAHLAGQIQEELRKGFSFPDRIAFRLHVEGYSFTAIASMVGGGDESWIGRRVRRMKQHLRITFSQAWGNLLD